MQTLEPKIQFDPQTWKFTTVFGEVTVFQPIVSHKLLGGGGKMGVCVLFCFFAGRVLLNVHS